MEQTCKRILSVLLAAVITTAMALTFAACNTDQNGKTAPTASIYVDDGKTVEITYEGSSTAQKWTYSISGDTLTMTDSDTGSVLTYTKK